MVNSTAVSLTEKKILRAANKVFRQKGMDGARMQDISDEAGINKALLHYYFRSKELLFERVFRQNADSFFSEINGILKSDTELFVKIRLLCSAYMDMCTENPHLPIFIVTEINKHSDSFLKKMFPGGLGGPDYITFRLQLEKEVKAGTIRPVKPAILIMNILSLCLFPTIARPMMQFAMGMTEKGFQQALNERKEYIPEMIIESIRKK